MQLHSGIVQLIGQTKNCSHRTFPLRNSMSFPRKLTNLTASAKLIEQLKRCIHLKSDQQGI